MADEREMKKVPYESISKKSLAQIIKDALPEGAYPTARTPKILGIIFIIVIVIGALQFPLTGIFGGSTKVSIKMGIPLTFLELSLSNPESNPVRVVNLILDILIYVFLSYLIDIMINIFMHSKWVKSKEELKGIPREYRLDKKI